MKIKLDQDQIFKILDDWCERKYGRRIAASVWEVEDDKEFQGVTIHTEGA